MGESVDSEAEGEDNDPLVLIEIGGGRVVVNGVEFACRDPRQITRPSLWWVPLVREYDFKDSCK